MCEQNGIFAIFLAIGEIFLNTFLSESRKDKKYPDAVASGYDVLNLFVGIFGK